MNTRPNGLHTKGQPATLREEQATIAIVPPTCAEILRMPLSFGL